MLEKRQGNEGDIVVTVREIKKKQCLSGLSKVYPTRTKKVINCFFIINSLI